MGKHSGNQGGRPTSKGLKYFAFNCNFFEDKKVRLIKAQFGAIGIMLLVYLYTQIYSDDGGYYMEYDDDVAMLIVEELGCGLDIDTVNKIIEGCIKRELFDRYMFEEYGILTSVGIQKRFAKSASTRDKIKYCSKYFLLTEEIIEDDEKLKSDKIKRKICVDGAFIFTDNQSKEVSYEETYENEEVSSEITTQRKEKKSKVNNSISIINPYAPDNNDNRPDFNTVEQYAINNLSSMSAGNIQEFESFREDFPDDVIKFAIDEASAGNIHEWRYVRKILNDWLDKGYKTLGDVKAAQERKRKQQTQQQQLNDVPRDDRTGERIRFYG